MMGKLLTRGSLADLWRPTVRYSGAFPLPLLMCRSYVVWGCQVGVELRDGGLVAPRTDNVVDGEEFLHVRTAQQSVQVSLFVALHLKIFKHL